jgi:pyruvate dehydrogenase E1 component beta subunit
MSKKSYRQAINEAIRQEMERDSASSSWARTLPAAPAGRETRTPGVGRWPVTKGLRPQFGPDRVLDTHLAEISFVGAAAGAAATGLRPIVELMFVDFMGVCFDQIFNQAAKFRYMFGGKAVTPLVCARCTAPASAPPRSTRSASIRCSPTFRG